VIEPSYIAVIAWISSIECVRCNLCSLIFHFFLSFVIVCFTMNKDVYIFFGGFSAERNSAADPDVKLRLRALVCSQEKTS